MHDTHHVGKFYTIDSTDMNKLDPFQESLSKDYYAEVAQIGSHYLNVLIVKLK
jgi:hypothetical protein